MESQTTRDHVNQVIYKYAHDSDGANPFQITW